MSGLELLTQRVANYGPPPIEDGWFTARQVADKSGESIHAVRQRMERMRTAGSLEGKRARVRCGGTNCVSMVYRLKGG